MSHAFLPRELPAPLGVLTDLALDLRWTWSHAGDALWEMLDPEIWENTRNPWMILQNVGTDRLDKLAGDPRFRGALAGLVAERAAYMQASGWYGREHVSTPLKRIAYFSMEFGLGEALPLYAGGLGILAGDFLKTASDLGVPVAGVGLLYQEGYSRQVLDNTGRQQDVFPYNDPTSLPIQPVLSDSGSWLHVTLHLPGRDLLLRVWQAQVGRLALYLLDANDPLNSPADRGITSKLYGGGPELRFLQELVLGIGGWRALEAVGVEADVCHLNEGHAAFVVLERARRFMEQNRVSFWEAFWATRAGNVFTTHTPVAAGFDTFSPELINKYLPYFRSFIVDLKLPLEEVLALGRANPHNAAEPFNMAYLAMRGCARANGVSRLHGVVSRRIFAPLFPRWPHPDVPVGHVTNGIHVPSWDSLWADKLWTKACGKGRWLGGLDDQGSGIQTLTDEEIWSARCEDRHALVNFARQRLARQVGQRGGGPERIDQARRLLDPNVLTLGFARRFTEYKRPNLLLLDPARLTQLLTNSARPVQLVLAGKAHPGDERGKELVQRWAEFVGQPEVRSHAIFIEDYDMFVAQELVRGVDVWINTPRRPWEACGTSGMKVLVNGGLNLSELDGWWAEAYDPEVGWALGNGQEHADQAWDAYEAGELYRLLEESVLPEFYERDSVGIPRAWVARIRASMASLTCRFSSNRMVCEYVDNFYLPAAEAYARRHAGGGELAKKLNAWWSSLKAFWNEVHFGALEAREEGDNLSFKVPVYLGAVSPDWVRVELYAEPLHDDEPFHLTMQRGDKISGAVNGHLYRATIPASRPLWHFTPRIVPYHPDALVPAEAGFIQWQR